jgi:hypothetical protein
MSTRILKVMFLIAFVAVATGCPSGLRIRAGTWLFNFADDGSGDPVILAIKLLADGSTDNEFPAIPAGADGIFGGTSTWQLDDEAFSMTQDNNLFINEYSGTVLSRTGMEGTVDQTNGNFSTTWVASWLEN